MVKVNPTCDKERVKDLKEKKKERKKDVASTKNNHWSGCGVDPVVHEIISLLLTQDKSVLNNHKL